LSEINDCLSIFIDLILASVSIGYRVIEGITMAVRLLTMSAVLLPLVLGHEVRAEELFTVAPAPVKDEKAVFATVESIVVEPARTRIGGTLAELSVREGDRVDRDQVVATVGDEKLVLQMKSLDAQIAALDAQVRQTQIDLARTEDLVPKGAASRAALDQARTAFNVATNTHQSRIAERAVIQEQLAQGNVLAPLAGRVVRVPLRSGSVVLPGESVAVIAEQNFVLRLRVPERHARFLKAGDPVRLDGQDLGKGPLGQKSLDQESLGQESSEDGSARFGTIKLVYPQIEDGRVVADATVSGLGDYFVGQRIRVWVSSGARRAIVIPGSYVVTRFGVDYVRIQRNDAAEDVPVQRGRDLPRPDMPNGLEILSGLSAGDRLVRP
jgi:RND family efflux transporter MFP subunit